MIVDSPREGTAPPEAPPRRRWDLWAVAAYVILLAMARVWGLAVVHAAHEPLYVDAVPFYGRWDLALTRGLALAAVVGIVGVVVLPVAARRLRWWHLALVVLAAGVLWSLTLAAADPSPYRWNNIQADYGTSTHLVDDWGGPGVFLRDYTSRQLELPTHPSAHPPGMVLLLRGAQALDVGGVPTQVGLAVGGAAVAALAVLLALREVAGEEAARRAAAFAVLVPAAVWHTNADVFFGGVVLAGVAAAVLATGRTDRWGAAEAVAGGVLFGAALLLSYGLALLAIPIVVVCAARRRWDVLAVVGVAAAAVLALPALWGFWWPAGLAATKRAYDANLARVRPYWYFLVGNLAVFAVAVGPATAVGLGRLRDRRTWLLVGAGVAVVAAADLSGMSSAETERIWQPFMPLVVLACSALVVGARRGAIRAERWWLALQVGFALALQAGLRSPW